MSAELVLVTASGLLVTAWRLILEINGDKRGLVRADDA